MNIPKLMLITDGSLDTDATAWDRVLTACQSGLPAIQLREKTLEAKKLWKLAHRLRAVTAEQHVFLCINDRIDIALAVDADAIHLPERSVSPQIPKKLKPSLRVGVSTHSLEMAKRAEQEGADYVLFGPIFKTPSKEAYGYPQGLEQLELVARTLSIPVIAVGGITASKVRCCLSVGAHGVAAVSALMQSKDPATSLQNFIKGL